MQTRQKQQGRTSCSLLTAFRLVSLSCKAPSEEIEQGISQTIRNQSEKYIPKLFCYTQLVMVVKANAASYATVGTGLEHWSTWQEKEDAEETVDKWVNTPLTEEQNAALSASEFAQVEEPARASVADSSG